MCVRVDRLAIGIGAYFIIGAAVMYKVKGARGVEVIPNYLFWKSVPILIKVCQLYMHVHVHVTSMHM